MGKSQRSKGTRGEQQVVRRFRDFGVTLKRVPNSGGLDVKGDVLGLLGYHVEVKFQETTSVWAWYKQSADEAPEGSRPLVIFRRSRAPWMVLMSLEDFIGGMIKENRSGEEEPRGEVEVDPSR